MASSRLRKRVEAKTLPRYSYSSRTIFNLEQGIIHSLTIPTLTGDTYSFTLNGTFYYTATSRRIKAYRKNSSYVELFPYADSPRVVTDSQMSRYKLLELIKKIDQRTEPNKMDNTVVFLGEFHAYIFAQICGERREPSMQELLKVHQACTEYGVEYRLSMPLEARLPKNYYDIDLKALNIGAAKE